MKARLQVCFRGLLSRVLTRCCHKLGVTLTRRGKGQLDVATVKDVSNGGENDLAAKSHVFESLRKV